MEKKVNADYTITDHISVGDETYVIGHNPDHPLVPYVTWAANEDLTYFAFGHYLQTRDEALLDLMKRATARMEIEGEPIAPMLLSQDDREKLHTEFSKENALADIESCLYDAFDHLDIDSDKVPELMSNPDFQSNALHRYYNIDHSYENEALSEVLENLIEVHFQEMLPKEFSAMLKISPEEMEIQNDVLHLTADEITEKYGAYDPGEGMLEFHQEISSPHGNADMFICIMPKETDNGTNSIHLWLTLPDGTDIEKDLRDVSTLEQIFSITDPNGRTWSVDLHADERMRRIGRSFIFQTDSDDIAYVQHNGKTCSIEQMLTNDEADGLCVGPMWKVRFEDGCILDVWDSELILPVERKYDLSVNPNQVKPNQSLADNLFALKPLEFIFDEDIDVSDDFSALNGYVWAVSSLIDRLKAQEAPLEEDQFMENINFYPVYNLNTGRISLEGHYYLEDSHHAIGKAFTLQLTPDESKHLRAAFEAYCLEKEGLSCLEFLHGRELDHNSERKPLADQIQSASIRIADSPSEVHEKKSEIEKTVF